jgi:tetratricopeptide (TPR) repeat protein
MKQLYLLTLTFFIILNPAISATSDNTVKSDPIQVNKWNTFVTELYELHLDLTKKVPISTTKIIGGYGGGFANKSFYQEISYFNKNTNKIISKIQWEVEQPNTIHSIEIFLYNSKGKVKTDFYARYLPYARNAPVQTLINVHNYNDKLHSFRQFDANGELIYETCRGYYFDKKINLHLDDDEISDFKIHSTDEFMNEAYSACFLNIAKTASAYLHPTRFIKNKKNNSAPPIELELEMFSQNIIKQPKNPSLYVKRGQIYFQLHEFDKAIDDFNIALSIDNSLQQAYFERGMALARNGQVAAGIKDLTHFIKYNPNSSLAYTKRGVRYIWAGKLADAKKDLLQALKLDNRNSEAHDDLGVIYAQQKEFDKAIKHFSFAIQYDPSYQKAYHNLAMAYVLTNHPQKALISINKALLLDNDSRNSLMLKSEILNALGKNKEAEAVIRKAEFLPEGNWSERFNIQ